MRFSFFVIAFCSVLFSPDSVAQEANKLATFPKGVYKNFKQLKMRKPITSREPVFLTYRGIGEWEEEDLFFFRDRKNGLNFAGKLAISMGDTTYIKYAGGWFPLMISNDSLFFYGFGPTQMTTGDVELAAIMFGGIGAGIAQSKLSKQQKESMRFKSKYYLDLVNFKVLGTEYVDSNRPYVQGVKRDVPIPVRMYRVKNDGGSKDLVLSI